MISKKYSDEDIITSIKKCYQEHKKISQNIYAKNGYKPSVDVISSRFGSWNEALKKAGLPTYERKPSQKETIEKGKYSDEYIIEQLNKCYEKHGKISMSIYNKDGFLPGRTTIIGQFGSWNKALEAAGLKTNKNNQREFSDEEVFQQLRECYKENDNFISLDTYVASKRIPKVATIIKYFGSWNRAVEKAGLIPNNSNIESYSNEDILNSLYTFYKKNGNYISSRLYQEAGTRPSLQVIQKRFGSWNEALRVAGLPINSEVDKRYSKEEIISILNSFYDNNGDITREMYFESGQSPHLHTIINYFGSWENALKEAGIEPTRDYKQYSKADIIKSIQTCYKENNCSMSISTYIYGRYEPKIVTIRRVFGSWEQAVKEANLPQFRERFTKDEVLEILKECYEQNEGRLTSAMYEEMREEPSVSYIKHLFNGSWNQALEQASLDVNIRYYSDEEIFKSLRQVYQDNHGIISIPIYQTSGKRPTSATIIQRFGTWTHALAKAGL